MMQLSFLKEDKETKLEREVQELKEKCEKLRKGQFAKISETLKLYHELKHDFEILMKAVSRNEKS